MQIDRPLVLCAIQRSDIKTLRLLIEIIDLLIYSGAHTNDEQKLMFAAIETRDIKVVNTLLKYGFDPNAYDSEHNTLLHQACSLGLGDIVDLLLQNGALIASLNSNGDTPLIVAAEKGHLQIIQLLENFRQSQS